jgi:hypothetical protein
MVYIRSSSRPGLVKLKKPSDPTTQSPTLLPYEKRVLNRLRKAAVHGFRPVAPHALDPKPLEKRRPDLLRLRKAGDRREVKIEKQITENQHLCTHRATRYTGKRGIPNWPRVYPVYIRRFPTGIGPNVFRSEGARERY